MGLLNTLQADLPQVHARHGHQDQRAPLRAAIRLQAGTDSSDSRF